jgi:pimeloyl-ACP methyl ester carboxylesterase
MMNFRGAARCFLLCYIVQAPVSAAPATNSDPSESLRALNAQNQDDGIVVKFTEGYITLDDTRLHYVSAGTGKLVVFYHGFPSYWYSWKHQLTALAKDYRVVAVDGLGANLSDKPTDVSAYHISNLARQLQQLTQTLAGQEDYVLVGHDWGGALAWSYAQQYPEGLDKLIVLSAPPTNLLLDLLRSDPAQQEASSYMGRLKAMGREKELGVEEAHLMWNIGYSKLIERGFISPAVGDQFKQALAQPGALDGGINWYRANIPATDAITEADFWPARSASTPVDSLLIWGEEDKTFVPAFLQKLPDYADHLRIEILPGVGHWPSLEAPEKVSDLIREFIESP